MMASLYAVLFSTGLIKVGRSKSPDARVAEHARRLACAGMKIASSVHAVCHGDVIGAEAALIDRCSAAASQRHKDEWFEGIDFKRVSDWVREEAALKREPAASMHLKSYIKDLPGEESREAFASKVGSTAGHLRNVMYGLRPCAPELAVSIQKATSELVMRWDLRPDDWARIWPELIGTKGAPPVRRQAAKA